MRASVTSLERFPTYLQQEREETDLNGDITPTFICLRNGLRDTTLPFNEPFWNPGVKEGVVFFWAAWLRTLTSSSVRDYTTPWSEQSFKAEPGFHLTWSSYETEEVKWAHGLARHRTGSTERSGRRTTCRTARSVHRCVSEPFPFGFCLDAGFFFLVCFLCQIVCRFETKKTAVSEPELRVIFRCTVRMCVCLECLQINFRKRLFKHVPV